MKWIKAFRLRTLPLAFAGWLVGISIAAGVAEVHFAIAGLTLITAFLLQILSNLANDFGDASSGVDANRIGEQRMVNAGIISAKAMKRAMIYVSFLALVSGIFLLRLAFPNDLNTSLIFLIIGLIGIGAAIKYTVGKNPYGYAGFGDIFVFIFFGLVLVFGTFYLQTASLDFTILLPAASLGFFSVGVLNVNNIRDIESDKQAGKYSIPVRVGRDKAIRYHIILLFLGVTTALIYTFLKYESNTQFLFLLSAFLFIKNTKAVSILSNGDLDPYLKQMAISTFVFSFLFALGQFLTAFFD